MTFTIIYETKTEFADGLNDETNCYAQRAFRVVDAQSFGLKYHYQVTGQLQATYKPLALYSMTGKPPGSPPEMRIHEHGFYLCLAFLALSSEVCGSVGHISA